MATFKRVAGKVLCALSITLPCAGAFADYPEKPLRIVVPYAPGATASLVGQTMAEKLTSELGQPVVADYRPGAQGNIGAAHVASSPPDGYTLLLGTISILAMNPSLYKNLSFDSVRDFQPISQVINTQNILVINPELPVRSVRELADYARANPGKLSFASPGAGSTAHLSGELFSKLMDVKMMHVPYKGGGPARVDLLGGRVSMMFFDLSIVQHVEAGQLRALAVTGAERASRTPDLPTMQELGYKDFHVESWYGLLAPKGTPEPVVQKLNAAIGRVLKMPDVIKAFESANARIAKDQTVAGFEATLRADIEKWRPVIESTGMKIE